MLTALHLEGDLSVRTVEGTGDTSAEGAENSHLCLKIQ